MDKINGYSAQEAEGLVEYISEGKRRARRSPLSFRVTAAATAAPRAAYAITTTNC